MEPEPLELSSEGSALPAESQGGGGGVFQADGTECADSEVGGTSFMGVITVRPQGVVVTLRGRKRSTQHIVSAQLVLAITLSVVVTKRFVNRDCCVRGSQPTDLPPRSKHGPRAG